MTWQTVNISSEMKTTEKHDICVHNTQWHLYYEVSYYWYTTQDNRTILTNNKVEKLQALQKLAHDMGRSCLQKIIPEYTNISNMDIYHTRQGMGIYY